MSPRRDVTEERRQQILDAAAAVFARKGFHEARMEDIAREADISKGTLYLYFESKDAIILTMMDRFFAHSMEELQALLPGYEGSIGELLLTLTRFFAAQEEQMQKLAPIAYEYYALSARRPEVRQFFHDYFANYRQGVAALIQLGIERGEFRTLDPQEVAVVICSIYEGLLLLQMADPQVVRWSVMGERAIQLVLDGLKKTGEE